MLEDLIVIAALTVAAAIRLAVSPGHEWRRLAGRVLSFLGRGLRRAPRTAMTFFRNRLVIWASLLVLAISVDIGATLAREGLSHTVAVATFGPSRQESEACHWVQARLHIAMSNRPRGGTIESYGRNVRYTPGELPEAFQDYCPHGGRLDIDDEGFLACSSHGRAEGLPRLWPVPERNPR